MSDPKPMEVRLVQREKQEYVASEKYGGGATGKTVYFMVLQQWKQTKHSVTDGKWQHNFEWVDVPVEIEEKKT